MKTYLRVLSYLRPAHTLVPQYFLYVILQSIFGVLSLTMLIPILNVLFQTDEAEDIVIPENPPEFSYDLISYFKQLFYYNFNTIVSEDRLAALQYVCIILIVFIFLANLFRYLTEVIAALVKANVISNLRNDLFQHLVNLHIGYFSDERRGNIMSKVTSDVQEVENSVVQSLKSIVKEPILMISYFVFLFLISVKLTLITLLVLPVSGFIISYIAKKLKKRARQSQDTLGRLSDILEETLGGIRIVKAFNAIDFSRGRFKKQVDNYAKFNVSMRKRYALAGPISEFLGVSVVAIILLIGGKMILEGTSSLEAGSFITFIVLFSQVLSPAKALSNAFSNVQRGLASADRIFQVIDVKSKIRNAENATDLDDFKKDITFKNVDFAYEQEKVLKNISLTIKKGEMVALVGPSGGGKSTLADLIPRFYDPLKGEISIDGGNIKQYTLHSLRDKMGIVSQESILFNDSIFNNIAFGMPESSEESVIQAAKVANAHEFIQKLENGYHTVIGDRGIKLSGGQRQRLSIARAVLKNPEILILDEATSALDSESELLVQQALSNLMKNRTSIVIAHRLSTIQESDRIYVLENGEIIEEGNHKSLIEQKGTYNKLIQIQSLE